ncbi:putative GNAT family acetyltransferase [Lasiosphaeria hispida]|uniref:GNAT family acetyltransferase n=1 Tax=Lasiosphaeria hispida TaxID=260671 RepID=A0AAJ0MIT6_9PEZI|nr:putative GNAT family acetyltransferase [Lasiosphaeria hispida]
MSKMSFQILPVKIQDVPTLAGISAEAMETDSQTEMKGYGKKPFLMREDALQSLPDELGNPKIRVIKAVADNTGAIMGFCIWGFRELQPPEFPTVSKDDGSTSKQLDKVNATISENKADVSVIRGTPEKELAEEAQGRETDDPIARLERYTSRDLKEWMGTIMPEGVSCLFVIGLSVSPDFQRRGVGSALLKWGTDIADAHDGAFAWVHSSAGAWRAYEKAGFRTVRTLDVDLDEYAPVPAPADRYEGGKWGRYVFRYMVYGTPPQMGD